MPRVVHFEIGADDPQRAIAFYEKTFGWKTTKWDGPMDYWLVTTGDEGEPGIDGAIQPRGENPPVIDVIGVSDIDRFRRLFERIRALDGADAGVSLRMTYDCVFGRYTLSVWTDDSIEEPLRKRAVVDAAVVKLAEVVASHADEPVSSPDHENEAGHNTAYPCGHSPPPCTLVIPTKELMCPFMRANEKS